MYAWRRSGTRPLRAPASKHSQTTHNGEARRSRDAPRLRFIQKDEVGWETLGQ